MENSRTKKALIIGAGIAGIASAIRLRAKGYEVSVFESNAYTGGKLSEIKKEGFRFDAGPSLFTMPQFVDELFTLAGEKSSDHFNYTRLDTTCNYFYPDGTIIYAYADKYKFSEEMAQKTEDSRSSILSFLKKSAIIYQITHRVFLFSSLHKISTFLRWNTFISFLQLPRIDLFRSMNKANKTLFKDSKTIQFFNRYATYNGSDPYKAPATLNVIPHLEHHFGAFFPDKGMYDITQSLTKLAERMGVKFQFNSRVEKIITENNKAIGLIANGKEHFATIVISNMDMVPTYKKLLPEHKHPDHLLYQPKSSSALIFYWGINKQFPKLDLHNIFFSADYEGEFDYIFRRKSIHEDPTVYVNISSKYLPSDAPKGCENWFVMINVPHNEGQDWDELISIARTNIIKKLNKQLSIQLEELIVCEELLDPRSIESRTSSFGGALYGNSSNNPYAAFLRHPNFSSDIKGLYFCGGSVHPGGGIPLALLSAKIVSDLLPTN